MTPCAYIVYFVAAGLFLYVIKTAWVRVDVAKRQRANERRVHEQTEHTVDTLFERIEEHESSLATAWRESALQLTLTQEIVAHREDARATSDDDWLQHRIDALGTLNDCNAIHLGSLKSDLRSFLDELTESLQEEFAPAGESTIVLNNISATPVPRGHGLYIAIALHELLRNAFVHAFAGRPADGRLISVYIDIFASSKSDNNYTVRVEDNGIGAGLSEDNVAAATGGLGLVRRVARRLDGQLSITDIGGCSAAVTLSFADV